MTTITDQSDRRITLATCWSLHYSATAAELPSDTKDQEFITKERAWCQEGSRFAQCLVCWIQPSPDTSHPAPPPLMMEMLRDYDVDDHVFPTRSFEGWDAREFNIAEPRCGAPHQLPTFRCQTMGSHTSAKPPPKYSIMTDTPRAYEAYTWPRTNRPPSRVSRSFAHHVAL